MSAAKTLEQSTPTREELYEAAVIVDGAAAVAAIIGDSGANDKEKSTAVIFLATVLQKASDILCEGLSV